MNLSETIANHFHSLFYGGNYTGVNLKQALEGLTWQQATAETNDLNSIAALVFHINYYIAAVLGVLHGKPLEAHDKYSFDHPIINSEVDWQNLLDKFWADADNLVSEIENLDPEHLKNTFAQEKYGTYHRNLLGLLEHSHYHLGQIVLITKLITKPQV